MVNFLNDKNISILKDLNKCSTIMNNNILKSSINRKFISENIIKNYIKDKKEIDDVKCEVKYDKLSLNDFDENINKIYKNNKSKENFLVFLYDEKVHLLVIRGKMNTGGYSVLIDNIYVQHKNNINNIGNTCDDIAVKVSYKNPPRDCMCIQCFTFPYTIVKTELDKLPNKVTFIVE